MVRPPSSYVLHVERHTEWSGLFLKSSFIFLRPLVFLRKKSQSIECFRYCVDCSDSRIIKEEKLKRNTCTIVVLIVSLGAFLSAKCMKSSSRLEKKAVERASLHRRAKTMLNIFHKL